MSTALTLDEVAATVPAHLRNSVTQNIVDLLNNISDPLVIEAAQQNFVSYSNVLREGRFKMEDYLNAVMYVSYKMMGYTNKDAYMRTFPQRHAILVAKQTPEKDIAAYISGYHKGKLVNLIMEQVLVPSWILNQDKFQAAINVQYDLMTDGTMSGKVRTDAANSLLTHLKKPDKVVQLNLGPAEASGMKEMREALTALATSQKNAIEAGTMKTIDVAASPLAIEDQDGT
jgi:hypothetical protein